MVEILRCVEEKEHLVLKAWDLIFVPSHSL
jgi:hypothetical protein